MLLISTGGGFLQDPDLDGGVTPNGEEGGKMDPVTQSIHWKCQCVIDCPSLAPRCCPPSDQYHHYPNYAAGLARSPLNWWSLLRERYAGTWMWGGGGGAGVILSSAESSWRSLAEREGTTQQGFFLTTVIRTHLNILWKPARSSVGYYQWWGTGPAAEKGLGGARDSFAGLYTLWISGGGLFKRLLCHFFVVFFFFWHWETVFFFERQQRRHITHNRDEMLSWSSGGKIRTCPNWKLTHIFYTTNLVQLHILIFLACFDLLFSNPVAINIKENPFPLFFNLKLVFLHKLNV